MLHLDKKTERTIVVLACYAIGFGAVLTPIGEPLSTIATARLAGPPHEAEFFFLAKLLWSWLIPGIAVMGVLAAREGSNGVVGGIDGYLQSTREDVRSVLLRAVKIYIFVAALVLLGRGLSPLVERYLVNLPTHILYWANITSAALYNATLATAELSPRMGIDRIRAVLLALLVSGGMLIPGNIPNIIAAEKVGIKSRDWANTAVPLGLILMLIYFVVMRVVVLGGVSL